MVASYEAIPRFKPPLTSFRWAFRMKDRLVHSYLSKPSAVHSDNHLTLAAFYQRGQQPHCSNSTDVKKFVHPVMVEKSESSRL